MSILSNLPNRRRYLTPDEVERTKKTKNYKEGTPSVHRGWRRPPPGGPPPPLLGKSALPSVKHSATFSLSVKC